MAGGDPRGVAIFRGRPGASGGAADLYFAEAQILPASGLGQTISIDIRALDLNGDQRLDLMLSQTTPSYTAGTIRVLMQTVAGSFVDETTTRMAMPGEHGPINEILPTDLNGDGHLDLLFSGSDSSQIGAYINDGTGHFDPAGPHSGYPALKGNFLLADKAGHVLDVTVGLGGAVTITDVTTFVGATGPAGADTASLGATGPAGADTASLGAPGFNEGFYLRQHPEVAKGVDGGRWTSGLAHYLAVGRAAEFEAFAAGTQVWGSAGVDLLSYAGDRSDYRLAAAAEASWVVRRANVTASDTLHTIERLRFTDTHLALDLDGHAGTVAKLLGALFGKAALANKVYASIGLSLLDGGMKALDLAALAVSTDAFAQLAGGRSNAQFVDLVYRNVVGSTPGGADRALYVDWLDRGQQTQASLALLAADTAVNAQQIDLAGLASSGLPYEPLAG